MTGNGGQFSWLDNLNALDPGGGSAASPGQRGGEVLPDDLRAQLEAWTTVTFEDDKSLSPVGGVGQPPSTGIDGFMRESQPQKQQQEQQQGNADAEYALKDPSPYAKRPFGNFGHNYSLERGFNAFDHSGIATGEASSDALNDIYAGLGFANNLPGSGDLHVNTASALFQIPDAIDSVSQESLFASIMQQQQQEQTTPSTAQPIKQTKSRKLSQRDNEAESTIKKQRLASASPATSASTPATSVSTPTTNATASTSALPKAPLSKAAILAAQLAELEAKKGLTAEEENARQAELNRVAAEDDKRRRNTAASARFRVKKKQREQALEDTVKGLNERIDKLEKDLEASRNENNFLRDLVIRKIGLSELANPGLTGRISGGQQGDTGMGTQLS